MSSRAGGLWFPLAGRKIIVERRSRGPQALALAFSPFDQMMATDREKTFLGIIIIAILWFVEQPRYQALEAMNFTILRTRWTRSVASNLGKGTVSIGP